MSRLPVELVHEALKTMPNQFEMTLTAALRAKELSKGKSHRQIDAALKDVADGVVGIDYMHREIKNDFERRLAEKLRQKGNKNGN